MARRVRSQRRWPQRLRLAAEVATVAVACAASILWASLPDTSRLADENPTTTAFIDLRREQAADAGKPFALQWKWRPLRSISRYLRAAVIYAEDARFYTHEGIDWEAIEVAFEKNLDRGDLGVGGSTITQQLAKNLYLSPSRSLVRKLRELLIAYSLEDDLTKQRILELYLNVAEWGEGVFGAEAAARRWFGHSAASLSPAEAARLAIALPNPFTRAPTSANLGDPTLRKKAVRIIRLLRMQGLIDASEERTALDQVGATGARVKGAPAAPSEPITAAPETPEPTP